MPSDAEYLARLKRLTGGWALPPEDSIAVYWAIERLAELEGANKTALRLATTMAGFVCSYALSEIGIHSEYERWLQCRRELDSMLSPAAPPNKGEVKP